MPIYTKVGPFTQGGPPGINKTFLDAVETQLAAVQFGTNILTSPYVLINGATINSAATNNYTCVGGLTGVPSGAKAVIINIYGSCSAVGGYLSMTPHGTAWVGGNYPILSGNVASALVSGSFLVVLDGSGIIDIKANGGANFTGIGASIMAYVY